MWAGDSSLTICYQGRSEIELNLCATAKNVVNLGYQQDRETRLNCTLQRGCLADNLTTLVGLQASKELPPRDGIPSAKD